MSTRPRTTLQISKMQNVVKQNPSEAWQSVSFDPVNLISARVTINFIKACCDFNKNLDNGVWLGRRTLMGGKAIIGVSLSIEVQLFHWAIMINGTLFQLTGKDKEGYCTFMKYEDESEKNSFKWRHLNSTIQHPKTYIQSCVKVLQEKKYKYSIFAQFDSKYLNCQTFAYQLLCMLGLSEIQALQALSVFDLVIQYSRN